MHPHICLKHNLQLLVSTFSGIFGSSTSGDRLPDEIRNCAACREKMRR